MIFWIVMYLILIVIIFIAKQIWLTYINPITFINITYLFWESLGRTGYLGQYLPSFDSASFILFNILIIDIFIIGGFGMPQITIRDIKKSKRIIIIKKGMLNHFLKIIRLLCLIVSIAIFINLVRMLVVGSLSVTNIRQLSYSLGYGSEEYTTIYFNIYIYYFYQYFIRGFAFFDLTFSLVLLLKESRKISFMTIVNFILWAFIMLSRVEILKAVILCFIILCMTDVKLNRTQKKVIKRAIGIILIAVVIIFSFRSVNKDKNVLFNSIDSLIVDFSGSNYMFGSFFHQYLIGEKIVDIPYILTIIGGFGTLIEYGIVLVFGYYFNHTEVNEFLTLGHDIGSSNHYNAFYTMFFEPLNTGGIIGCFVFSILLGFIVGILYKRFYLYKGTKNLYLCAYFIYIIVMGTYNFSITVSGALVIIFCMLYKDKNYKLMDIE